MPENDPDRNQYQDSVLVVDEDAATCRIISNMLSDTGCDVITCGSGSEACQIAQRTKPNLILLDTYLPDMSGFDALKALKIIDQTRDIPVMIISTSTLPGMMDKALSCGAVDVIAKPIDRQLLLNKAKTFIQLRRDAREIRHMHDELLASHAELMVYKLAIDSVPDAVVISSPTGTIQYFNRAFIKLTGESADTPLTDRNITTFFLNPLMVIQQVKKVTDNTPTSVEAVLWGKGGEYPVLVKCSTIQSAGNDKKKLVFLIIDQTERKLAEAERLRLESELFHGQKLEAVGQLASGIAHEINTPIQFVSDNLRFMQDTIPDLHKLQQARIRLIEEAKKVNVLADVIKEVEDVMKEVDVDYIHQEIPSAIMQSLEGTERVASIVRAMKDFAHPGSVEKTMTDLNEAIRTTITVTRNRWKYVAEMETCFDEELPLVQCQHSEFNQVILNLIMNASDAIADKSGSGNELGKITISTRRIDSMVEVRVMDTGDGIPKDIQKRIFEPFFTTKEVGKGSGQGLCIAHSVIVQKHHGRFDFETIPGNGTTFIIQLPIEQKG
ncbi:MAG: response regulator [Pontiellaceae bacterium]|nr:response regulator [Pontiellaceae bacterium]MBN2786166.1 response regulator [Pontiellaceae bacterium]